MKSTISLIWCGFLTVAFMIMAYLNFRSEISQISDRARMVDTVKNVIQFPSKVATRIRQTARSSIHTDESTQQAG